MKKLKKILALTLLLTLIPQLCSCNSNNNSLDNNSSLVDEGKTHTLSFDTDGGNEIAPIVQETGTNIKIPYDPIKEGYTFIGWDKKVPDTMPNSDMIFKAQWIEGTMRFSIERNGTASIISYKGEAKELFLPNVIYNEYKLVEIRENAFASCTELTSITIPTSVVTMGRHAFYNCDSLIIYCESTAEPSGWDLYWNYSDRPVYYGVTRDNIVEKDNIIYVMQNEKAIVVRYIGSDAYVTIPRTIEFNGKTHYVTSIGKEAFYYCTSLTSITLPISVTEIGKNTFLYCPQLENVYYEGSIEDWCHITFGNGTSNPMYYAKHFYMLNGKNEYEEVTSIEIPDTITRINDYQFYGFNNVTSITISSNVIEIGENAFQDCSSLTIYCETETQPSGWDSNWNNNCKAYLNASGQVTINGLIYTYNKINSTAIVVDHTNELPIDYTIPETIIIDEKIYYVRAVNDKTIPLELIAISEVKEVAVGQ